MSKVTFPNPYFVSLIENLSQVVVIDANLVIPPDRTNILPNSPATLRLSFEKYRVEFLDPLMNLLGCVAIHDAVYAEVTVDATIGGYIDSKIAESKIIRLSDSDLTEHEGIIRNTTEYAIAQFTTYSPELDNTSDRGEVKSIAYAIAKNMMYFSTNDSNALALLERAELKPYIHSLHSIKLYELVFLVKKITGNSKTLRGIYRLLYLLTSREKSINPDWSEFISKCEELYGKAVEEAISAPHPQK